MYKEEDMNAYPNAPAGSHSAVLALTLALFLAAGCSFTTPKKYRVDVRVPKIGKVAAARRARLVLRAADALTETNLSGTEEYVLQEKKPLTTVLLAAAADRMQAAGIEPLEESEAAISSGWLLVVLTRLQAKLEKRVWYASVSLRGEHYSKQGRAIGKWEVIGRGSHPDSRLAAGGAGLAMGKAISRALNKLPWQAIGAKR